MIFHIFTCIFTIYAYIFEWYFCIDNSQWEIDSTISLDSNDSLAGISDFSVEVDSENGSDSDYSHDGSESCESDTDSEYVPEPSTSAGKGRGKKSRNATHNRKEASGGKQGRTASSCEFKDLKDVLAIAILF